MIGLHFPKLLLRLPVRSLLAVVALAVGLRLAVGFVEPMNTQSDAASYLAMATSAAEGRGLVDVFGHRAYYSAGYPMLLAAVFLVTGPSLGAVWVVNLVLAAVAVVLVYCVARCAARGGIGDGTPCPQRPGGYVAEDARAIPRFEQVGLAAAMIWAGYLPGLAMTNDITKENLMVPLMLGLVWIALAWPGSRYRLGLAALGGGLTGMLAVVGATGCAVAGAPVAVILAYAANWRQRLTAGGAFALAALAVVAPWLYRNHVVVGAAVLNTNGGQNLYLGNNPAATGRYVCTGDTPLAGEWHRILAEKGEVAAHREAARQARRYMRQYPGRTLVMSLRKAALFWEPPNLWSAEPEPLVKRVARYVWFVQYFALLAAALAGLRNVRLAWPLYLAVVLFAAAHVPFYAMFRYRLPIMAVVGCLAGVGVRCQVSGVRGKIFPNTGARHAQEFQPKTLTNRSCNE